MISSTTDIDVASEATVRVVLERLRGSASQLCDVSTSELTRLQQIVSDVTYTARGDGIFELNSNAYELALNNVCVQDALQKATDSDVDGTPITCLRYHR